MTWGLVWIAPDHRQALLIAGDRSIASDPLGGRPHAFTRLLEKAEVRQIRIMTCGAHSRHY